MSTQEDDILLEDFSRRVGVKSSCFFLSSCLSCISITIWLSHSILHLDIQEYAILYVVVGFLTTLLVWFSYKNCKFYFKHQFAQKCEEAIRKEVNSNNKLSRKEKDDLILSKKNEVADYESTIILFTYNNLIFLVLVLFLSFLLFKRMSPVLNYTLSNLISSALVALFSTGSSSQKKA